MWDKFDALRDTERNKQLIAIIKTEKDTVQAVQRTYNVNWGNEFVEPNLEMVSYGALVRCCTCLESMLLLARNGYIGSANALLRQVYESLVWAKMTIDTDDERILFQLHDGFYENTMRDRTFVSFLNRIAYQTDGSGLTSEAIISEGKKLYSNYAAFTHAGRLSQQVPIKTIEFTDSLEAFLGEVAIWINCLFSVTCQFRLKCQNALCEREINNTKILLNYGMYSYLVEEMDKYRRKLYRYFDNIDDDTIYRAFNGTKWIIR